MGARPSARAAVFAALAAASVAAFAPRAAALQPVSHYHDLVAGDGQPGFRDGEFQHARFRAPSGLAVLAARGLLLVSDRDDHRIRTIRLEEANRVETAAGSGKKGTADGPLARAEFDAPSGLVAISDDAVLVNDEGSALFRLVDLAKGRVETIAGNGQRGAGAGAARSVPLGGVWSLLFVPAEEAVYFSQPELHALRKLDLRTRTVTMVLQDDPRLPRPGALALLGGRVYVAERNGVVVRLGDPSQGAPLPLEGVGSGERILSMAVSGDALYATQGKSEAPWVCVTTGERGLPPAVVSDAPPVPWLTLDEDAPAGFAADPRGERSFFLTSPELHAVVSLKDYRFGVLSGARAESGTGLVDFSYPPRKPAGTFRILVLGDSHVNFFGIAPSRAGLPDPGRVETMPKRLELMLNSLSALEDGGRRFEVLSLTRASWDALLVWPNYRAIDVVRKFDVDLVLLMQPPSTNTLEAYLDRPITDKGIPADAVDPEYLLKPHAEKIRGNPAAALVDRARQLGWVHSRGEGQVYLEELKTLITDDAARRELVRLFARPLGALRDGIRAARPETKLAICYFPLSMRGSGVLERGFWKELADAARTEWLDLLDPFVVLKDTWFPYAEGWGYDHFSPQGHAFFAFVAGHELVRIGLVPFRGVVALPPRATPGPASVVPTELRPRYSVPLAAIVAAAGVLIGFLAARMLLHRDR